MTRRSTTLILLDLDREIAGAVHRELVTDLLTFDEGDLLVWEREQVVFRCPVCAVVGVAFAPSTTLYTTARREDLASANTRWSSQDDERLRELHASGVTVGEIARELGRAAGSIRTRLARKGLRRGSDASERGRGADPEA